MYPLRKEENQQEREMTSNIKHNCIIENLRYNTHSYLSSSMCNNTMSYFHIGTMKIQGDKTIAGAL